MSLNLLVPPGTSVAMSRDTTKAELIKFSVDQVVNGVVVNKLFVVTEAPKQPYQTQQTFVYKDMKEALQTLQIDIQ